MARKKREESPTVVTPAAKLVARLRETARSVRENSDDLEAAGLLLVAADAIEHAEVFAASQRGEIDELNHAIDKMSRGPAPIELGAPPAPRPRRGRPPKPAEAAPVLPSVMGPDGERHPIP
jgi:hypothetical protein